MLVARARRSLLLLASLLVASTFGCVRSKPENRMMRLGDDVLASGWLSEGKSAIPGGSRLPQNKTFPVGRTCA